ncbi:MAG: putative DNA-binding domain-containing protein [Alphaproteobacteria bacterium]|nr:putative DNA-binding domain-containing protein [Alphaproteobacteria bacterium]
MNAYAKQLAAFNNAIIDQDEDMLSLIKPTRLDMLSPAMRLAVYQKGYIERLIQATCSDYPTLQHYMGEDVFMQAVKAYVTATPSRVWDLNRYPFGFADGVKTMSADQSVHALALLESAIADVFWLPDSVPLDASHWAAISLEQLASTHFKLRTASRLLALDCSANAYMSAFREGNMVDMTDNPEYLCVVRHRNEVRRLVLDVAEYHLLSAIHEGLMFNEALEKTASLPGVDVEQLVIQLPQYLSRWFGEGVFR